MTKKKIIPILALFLVLFIAVGAASAADDIAVTNVNDGSDMGVAVLNGGEPGQVSTPGSFSDLQTAIDDAITNNKNLTLEKNYTFNPSVDTGIDKSGVLINGVITIDGNGKTLSGAGLNGILKVTAKNVVIKNLNFINGNVTSAAPVYWAAADGELKNCSFKDSQGYLGGELRLDGSNIIVSDCSFEKGYATWNGGAVSASGSCKNTKLINCVFKDCTIIDSKNGGAISAGNGMTIQNCNFTNCTTKQHGGAMIVDPNVSIIGCNFDKCTAYDGGAIYVDYDNITIKDCKFTNCDATNNGGVIYLNYHMNSDIDNCYFDNCSASGSGGAIYSTYHSGGAKNTIRNSYFNNCKANTHGDSIYVNRYDMNIVKCVFVNNGVASKEAIFEVAASDIIVDNCIFDTVKDYAAICRDQTGSTFIVKNTYFNGKEPVDGVDIKSTGNNVRSTVKVNNYVTLEITGTDEISFAFKANDSAVIDMPDYDVTVEVVNGEETTTETVTISGNSGSYTVPDEFDELTIKSAAGNEFKVIAPVLIDVVYISIDGDDSAAGTEDAPVATLAKALKLVKNGGSIVFLTAGDFVTNNVLVKKSVTITGAEGTVLDGNNAGRILDITATDVVIKDLTFTKANSTVGGAILVNEGASLSLNNVKFLSNLCIVDYDGPECVASGSAVLNHGNLTIDNCYFKDNYANARDSYNGGAVASNGNLIVKNSKFLDNAAEWDGGAIFSDEGNATIINCYFNNSRAYQGATIWACGDISIINCTIANGTTLPGFVSNSISGGLFLNDADAYVEGCTFEGNTANAGAAICNFVSRIKVVNTTFTNNKAVYNGARGYGGTFWNLDQGWPTSAILENCKFINNTATNDAGSIISNAPLTITGCTFEDNVATYDGGAIYSTGDLTISDTDFINNKGVNGGTIICSGTVDITGCTFKDSTATKGGAIYSVGTLTISGSEFISNTAVDAGAIYSTGDLDIKDSKFTNNLAYLDDFSRHNYGGAIYANGGSLTVDNTTFEGNCPDQEYTNDKGEIELRWVEGGAIKARNADVIIKNSLFNNNTARYGSACQFEDCANVQLIDSKFTSNNVYTGAIYTYGSNTKISGCEFLNNEAKYVGSPGCSASGADIVAMGADVEVTIENCKFDQSSATSTKGGAGSIQAQDCKLLTVKDSTFTSIKSVNERGALHVIRSTVNLNNAVFDSCVSNKGAAISAKTGTVNADNCKFINNNGGAAGVIYAYLNSALNIKNSVFDSNIAANGPIVVIDSSNAVFDGDNFTNNHAKNGVVISATGKNTDETQLTISNSEFINNDANIPVAKVLYANGGDVNAVVESGVNSVISGNNFEENSNKAIVENQEGATTDVSGEANTVKDNGGAEGNDGYILNNGKIIGAVAVLDTPVIAVQRTETGTTETVIGFKGHIETENGGTLVYQPGTVEATLQCEEQAQDYTLPLKSTTETDKDFANYMLTTSNFDASKGISVLKDKLSVSSLEDNGKVFITQAPDGSLSQLVEVIKLYNEGAKDTPFALDKDYAYNASCDGNLSAGIVISQSIDIEGNGFTINGGDKLTNLFIVNNGVTLGLSNVVLTGCKEAPINAVAGNNAVVLDAVTYNGDKEFVTLGSGSNLTANDCVAPYSFINYVDGANIVNPVVVIGATENDHKVYDLTATVTVGNIPVNGLGFKFTATYADGSSEPIADAAAKEGANGVYYLDGTDFAGKTGKIIVGANLANADVVTKEINRVPTIMVEKNYNVTKGDVVPVVVIVDGFVASTDVHLWAQTIPDELVFTSMEIKDGKYYYTFNVPTSTSFAGKEMALTARLSAVDSFGETVYVATDSTKKIYLNNPHPSIADIIVSGSYDDLVNITFIISNDSYVLGGDKVVLHLLNGTNLTKVIGLGAKNVTFTNVLLPFYSNGQTTNATYMRANGEILDVAVVTWNIAKINSTVNFNVTDITSKPGQEETVVITVLDANGKAVKQGNITVSGEGITLDKTVYELDANGQATVSFKCTAVGEYSLKVAYTGGVATNNTDNYNPSENTLAIEIIQTTVTVTVTNTTPSGKVNDNITITGTVTDEFGAFPTGHVEITVNSKKFTAVVGEDGSFTLKVNATESGKWTDTVKFVSNNTSVWDNAKSVPVTVSVRKLHTYIVSEYDGEGAFIGQYGQNKVLNFTVYDENGDPVNGGTLIVWFNGVGYEFAVGADGNVVAQNDSFVWNSTGLYNYVVDYVNNGKVYYDSFNFTNVNIPKIETKVVIDKNVTDKEGMSTVSGGKVTIKFTVTDVEGKVNVTKGVIYYVTPDGIEHSIDVVNGVATITVDVNRTGTYYIAASYIDLDGDFLYSEADFTWDVQLTSTLIAVENIDGNLVATVKVNDDLGNKVNGAVDLFVNGKLMSLNVVNGVASVNLGAYNGPVELNAVFTGADGLVSSDSVIVELAAIPENGPATEEVETGLTDVDTTEMDTEDAPGVDNETTPEVDKESAPAGGVSESSGIPMQHTAIPVFALILALLALPFCYRRD